MNNKKISDLVVGDQVLISESTWYTRGTIQSITPAGTFKISQNVYTEVNGQTIGKEVIRPFLKSGVEQGAGTWRIVSIIPFDLEIWNSELERRHRKRLINLIRDTDWYTVPTELLESVSRVIKGKL